MFACRLIRSCCVTLRHAARKDLSNLISSVNENYAPATITNGRGKGAVLVGEDEWSAIEEILYLNSIPGVVESILASGA